MPSIVYKVSDENFSIAVQNSKSIREVLIKLNLDGTGSAYRVFRKRVLALNLDISHFLGQAYMKGKTHNWAPKKSFNEILISNSKYTHSSNLKKRLLDSNLLENKCYECGQLNIWNNKILNLQLDHINGIHNDHRIENLRLLCPNCHSQTSTFAGRNKNGGNRGT